MIRKTALEIKQEQLLKAYKAKQLKRTSKKWKSKRNVKPVSKYPNIDYLKGLPYADFLASEYWSIVRTDGLIRDKYKCVICGSNTNLQVHHDTYKHHFKEHKHLDDLMTLCRDCHKEHHYAQP